MRAHFDNVVHFRYWEAWGNENGDGKVMVLEQFRKSKDFGIMCVSYEFDRRCPLQQNLKTRH